MLKFISIRQHITQIKTPLQQSPLIKEKVLKFLCAPLYMIVRIKLSKYKRISELITHLPQLPPLDSSVTIFFV